MTCHGKYTLSLFFPALEMYFYCIYAFIPVRIATVNATIRSTGDGILIIHIRAVCSYGWEGERERETRPVPCPLHS